MQTIKTRTLSVLAITAISLLALSCGKAKPNVLQRPIENTNDQNTNSDSAQADDNGQVAGDVTPLPMKIITVASQSLNVEIADNDATREQGLSDREKLDEGKGMLFEFTNTDVHQPGFWMKDMLFSIDIIWINNGKVIGIQANAPLPPQDADLPVYYPPSDVTQVLEVPAGWSAKNNVVVGDNVKL